jgi:hypothetical protein
LKRSIDRRTWIGLFMLAAATLAFEINLTRLFSVSQFYHLAFMIVSIALLGFGASGTALAILPALQRDSPHERMGRCACAAGASILLAYLLINWLPFDSFSIAWDRRQVLILALHYTALAAPFFFSGVALGSLLGQFAGTAGTIYAANLLGSGVGCLLALAAPGWVGGEGAVTLYAGLAGLAALVCSASPPSADRRTALAALGLVVFSLADVVLRASGDSSFSFLALRLSPYKGLSYALQSPGAEVTSSRWNAFSRIDLVRDSALHSVPGLSYRYLDPLPSMYGLFVDGDDLSPVVEAQQDSTFVSYLPIAIAFELRPDGSALILGPRGGLDVLAALTLNSGPKTVVEANPLIRRIAPIYADPRLQVHAESERSFLRRTDSSYDVIVVSLPSGYHPVRSGAYALGEDYRYTVEAYEEALQRLAPGGVMISTRWLQEPPSEDLRLFALALTALERTGGDPRMQLVAFRGFNMAAVMLKNGEYTASELSAIRDFLESRAFDLSYAPDVRPEETNRHNVLRESEYYETYSRLTKTSSQEAFFGAYEYDVSPPTDDRPFFGHYFKWRQAPQMIADFGRSWQPFGGAGYFVILAVLLLAVLLAGALILIPVALRGRGSSKAHASFSLRDLLYFGFLGFGFLLVEIPLLQLFILYLEQPAYAAGMVLASLLLFSGIGSRLSPSIPLRRSLAVLVAAVLLIPSALHHVIDLTLGLPLAARMALTALMLAPVGLLMGVPFPARIRLMTMRGGGRARNPRAGEIPWIWAINGAASVIASILAALLALTFGFALVLRIGAICYAGALLTEMSRLGQPRSPDQ